MYFAHVSTTHNSRPHRTTLIKAISMELGEVFRPPREQFDPYIKQHRLVLNALKDGATYYTLLRLLQFTLLFSLSRSNKQLNDICNFYSDSLLIFAPHWV